MANNTNKKNNGGNNNGKKFNNTNNNGGGKKFGNNTGKKFSKPEPVIDPVAKELAEMLAAQIKTYLDYAGEDFRARDNALFRVDSYGANYTPNCKEPRTWTNPETNQEEPLPYYDLFIVRRSVRSDRETGDLMKAQCDMLIADHCGDYLPCFFLTAFMNRNGEATIEVVPQTEDGPDFRNTYRWTNFTRTYNNTK